MASRNVIDEVKRSLDALLLCRSQLRIASTMTKDAGMSHWIHRILRETDLPTRSHEQFLREYAPREKP